MRVSRWGNSLAVRLPVELVRDLNLKGGDQIDLMPGKNGPKVLRRPSAEEVLRICGNFVASSMPPSRQVAMP